MLASYLCKAQVDEKSKTNIDSKKQEVLCDLLPRVRTSSSLEFYAREISEVEYNSRKKKNIQEFTFFSNSDSIEDFLIKKYPNIFKKVDNGYNLESYQGGNIKIKNNIVDSKAYSKYTFKGKYNKYIFVKVDLYEGGQVIIIDTETNKSISTPGKPYFINDDFVYSYAFDYGTSDIHIFDLRKKESLLLSFENLILEDTYNISNHIRFKVKCLNSMETKYIEILKY